MRRAPSDGGPSSFSPYASPSHAEAPVLLVRSWPAAALRGRQGRRHGRGAPRSSGRATARAKARRGSAGARPPGQGEDDAKGKKAGWGGVARKGAGRMRDAGPGDASKAFRAAAPEGRDAWEPEVWIDEGVVRGEASKAVGRGRSARRGARPGPSTSEPATDPSLRRAVAAKAADRLEGRLKDASKAFRRERFEEARAILRPLAETAPTAESVRELLGLTYYRLGRWKLAVTELEAFRMLNGSTEQHPVLADCYRALGRHAKVAELWEELRAASPERAARGRGAHRLRRVAGRPGQARGRHRGARAPSKPPNKRPQEHHLRVTYALADLHERAGDVPRARQLFGIVAAADPELGDVDRPAPRAARSRRSRQLSHARPSVGGLPPPRSLTASSEAPMSKTTVPAPGTNLSILVGTLSRDAEVRDLPSGDQVLALELTVRPEGAPGRVRAGRLVRRRRRRRPRWPAGRSSSSSAGCAGGSSGPAAPRRAARRWWPPPPSPPAGRRRRARRCAPRSRRVAGGCDGSAGVRHDGGPTAGHERDR